MRFPTAPRRTARFVAVADPDHFSSRPSEEPVYLCPAPAPRGVLDTQRRYGSAFGSDFYKEPSDRRPQSARAMFDEARRHPLMLIDGGTV